MKKKHLCLVEICEYLFIVVFLVLPPITLSSQSTVNLNSNYDLYSVFFRVIVLIYLAFRLHDNAYTKNLHIKSKISCINMVKPLQVFIQTIVVLFLLISISMLFSYISTLSGNSSAPIHVSPPQTIVLWLWFILGTIIFACFEEILFRRYLPDQAMYFFSIFATRLSKKSAHLIKFIIEIFFIVLFALSHRYMGLIAVCVALCSAIVLRLSVYKYGSLIPACIAHSLNNLLAFLLLFYT